MPSCVSYFDHRARKPELMSVLALWISNRLAQPVAVRRRSETTTDWCAGVEPASSEELPVHWLVLQVFQSRFKLAPATGAAVVVVVDADVVGVTVLVTLAVLVTVAVVGGAVTVVVATAVAVVVAVEVVVTVAGGGGAGSGHANTLASIVQDTG